MKLISVKIIIIGKNTTSNNLEYYKHLNKIRNFAQKINQAANIEQVIILANALSTFAIALKADNFSIENLSKILATKSTML